MFKRVRVHSNGFVGKVNLLLRQFGEPVLNRRHGAGFSLADLTCGRECGSADYLFMRCVPKFILMSSLAAVIVARSGESAVLPVANPSFELPATDFVDLRVESWQKVPKPDWFVETPGQTWDQLIGTFKDDPKDALDNISGSQAIYLFAVPQVGLFQDLATEGGATAITFQEGIGYQARFGVVGGRGNMKSGVTLTAMIYFKDSNGNQVPVAQTVVTNSAELFPSVNHLVEFTVDVPPVSAGDAWVGKQMGILFVSTTAADLAGGYWDLDNIRISTLDAAAAPQLTAARQGNNLRVSWGSFAGRNYQLQATPDLRSWADRGSAVAGTGSEMSQILPLNETPHLFLRLLERPAP